jgi:AraC family transcriptional regulator
MHKKETTLIHSKLANDLLNYINDHIQTDINLDELAYDLNVSKYHLHKVFKEQMGSNIYETIKSIRLQKASNLLITNKYSTITEVANICGYSSQTSFIRAFKHRFNQTPKQWRQGGYKHYSNQILSASESASLSQADFSHLEPKVVRTKRKKVYYIRQKGYDRRSFALWQKMIAWVYTNEIENYEQIGIYHDNPVITPLNQCQYVACIGVDEDIELKNTNLPTFDIFEGICAKFDIEGKYGDILKIIQWVYHHWLPDSGFETTTYPSYTIFEKNHFLSDDGLFKGEYYLPIQYV